MLFIELWLKTYIESWGQTWGTSNFDLWVRSVPASRSEVPGIAKTGKTKKNRLYKWFLKTPLLYSTATYCTILYSTVQYCTVLYSVVQCGAEASPPPKKNKNSEDPSGSIRDITAHLIHDKNTSIAEPCIVFNEESAGYDPGWICWSYEFLFFRPRWLRTRRPAQTRPGGQNRAFQRFGPMILCSCLWRIRWTTLENHSSKQMMVYEQITFFIKN